MNPSNLPEVTKQLSDVAKQLADHSVAINMVWVLLCGCLVMFMQAGFALLETGLVRAKNMAHTMAMNFFVYAVSIIGFWAIGFALQMGGVGALATFGGETTLSSEFSVLIGGHKFGLFGTTGFFLTPAVYSSAVAATFFFQMVFMNAGSTIPTGALAERWRFSSFVLFSLIISTLIYPVYANWVWGGGWLATLGTSFELGHGHVDFAGSSVVHLTGGTVALIGAKLLGPRAGKFGPNGEIYTIPGHNLSMVVLGTFVLAFGWFGFNAGSTLAGTDVRIAVVIVNTALSSAAGAFSSYLLTRYKFAKPDLSMMCNGMLAGSVAITAPCAFVTAPAAVLIGAIAGVLVVEAALFIERRLKIDDPVGASSVHGVCGAWGVLALGLFADGSYGDGLNGVAGGVRGFFYGDRGQLMASAIGIIANLVYVGSMAAASLWALDRLVGNRVTPEDEVVGLDIPELGVPGYMADPALFFAGQTEDAPQPPPPPTAPPPTAPAPYLPSGQFYR